MCILGVLHTPGIVFRLRVSARCFPGVACFFVVQRLGENRVDRATVGFLARCRGPLPTPGCFLPKAPSIQAPSIRRGPEHTKLTSTMVPREAHRVKKLTEGPN